MDRRRRDDEVELPMVATTFAADDHRSVQALLEQLHTRHTRRRGGGFRQILPAYERLLAHRDDAHASTRVVSELSRVRSQLRRHADMFGAVQRLDHVADWCLRYAIATQTHSDAFPMDAALRLLLALSGGRDGHTFRLDDPTRVVQDESSRHSSGRIGERIRMRDVSLVLASSALFDAESMPLHGKRVLSQARFGLFEGVSECHSSLWTPDLPTVEPSSSASPDSPLLAFSSNQFMYLATEATEPAATTERQWSDPQLLKWEPTGGARSAQAAALGRRRDPEVFFFDGSKEVHCGNDAEGSDWEDDDTSTQTAGSSEDSTAFELADLLKPARVFAWEDVGATGDRPVAIAEGDSAVSLLQTDPAVGLDDGTLEVYEGDAVEDALRALSGVESAIFRRDLRSACFQLPEKRALKLRFGTPASLASALEAFREAGSSFLRLEFLATYYAQDSKRGGKSLQAMGDALLLFLYAHRSAVEALTRAREGVTSMVALLVRTRHLRRQLRFVAGLFLCLEPDFWPLILENGFPRGIAMSNHLHDKVSRTSSEDASGGNARLATWFLVKSSAPFLEVLTEFVSLGSVSDATDPLDEFELTTWSRLLTELSFRDKGDGLLAGECGGASAERMLPAFLRKVADQVVRLGVVQRVLQRCDSGLRSSAPTDNEPKQQRLDSLLDIHPFFSHHGTDEDLETLMDALSVSVTPYDLVSFPLIVHRCVEAPVSLVGRTLDRLGVEFFVAELHVMQHLRWLHSVMLMSEGLCMDIFARDLLAGLRSPARVTWALADRLTSALAFAMIESKIHSDAHAQRFHYATSDAFLQALGSMTKTLAIPSLLRDIALQYKVDWPLGAVVSAASLRSYADMHRRLLYLRLTSVELGDAWMVTRKAARGAGATDALLQHCDDVFFKTRALLNAFSEAFVTTLESRASSVSTLLALRQAHESFVATALGCCFLDAASSEILDAVDRVLAVAWKLSAFVRTSESQLSGTTTAQVAWARDLRRDHDAATRDFVARLQALQSGRDRSVREFATHVSTRLTFNAFYTEQDA
ncbi:hypothetical protein PybrP1_002470 [[Pythium] brassicae (nom. inval.)]|nr:hypothetical protein PybrP1_002470 [[Pythium] brassicae (nom. inval.)]